MQFFDIEFLESWESKFDLSPESGAPFGYLEQRARDFRLRYRAVVDSEVKLPARPERPKPFDNLSAKATAHSIELAKELFNASKCVPESPSI